MSHFLVYCEAPTWDPASFSSVSAITRGGQSGRAQRLSTWLKRRPPYQTQVALPGGSTTVGRLLNWHKEFFINGARAPYKWPYATTVNQRIRRDNRISRAHIALLLRYLRDRLEAGRRPVLVLQFIHGLVTEEFFNATPLVTLNLIDLPAQLVARPTDYAIEVTL